MYKCLLLLVFIVLFSACSEKSNRLEITEQEGEIDVEAIANFEEGDVIGIYPVGYKDGQPGVPGDIAYPINLPFVFDGDGWNSQEEEQLFVEDEQMDVYAYYPYDPGLGSEEGKLDFSNYRVDLSGEQAQKNLDIRWAKSTLNTELSNIAMLEFNHILSKITIRLNMGNIDTENVAIGIYNLHSYAVLNLADGTVSNTNDKQIIYAAPLQQEVAGRRFFEAIIPPQTIASGVPLLLIMIDDQQLIYTTSQVIQVNQATNYTFNLTVDLIPETGN